MTVEFVSPLQSDIAPIPRTFEALAELVQMLAGLDVPYKIEVRSGLGERGQVGVARGRVVHARVGDLVGVQAFLMIMSWSDAEIVERSRAPQPVSIELGLAQLLLDAYWYAEDLAMMGDEQTETFDDSITPELPVESLPPARASSPISLDRARRARAPLAALRNLAGFVAAAELDAGEAVPIVIERSDTPFELGAAAIANAGLMRAGAFGALGVLEDVVVTLGDQYHLMRPIDADSDRYLYLALERAPANLALARLALSKACRACGERRVSG